MILASLSGVRGHLLFVSYQTPRFYIFGDVEVIALILFLVNGIRIFSKNLGDRVARALMSKYGVLLSEGQVGKGYELAIDDPVAKLLSRYFTISTPKRKMDHSPSELEGEIDHLSKDAAVEYLLMPERVKKLEGQILGLSSQIADLRSDVSQLVQILKESIIA